MQVKEENVSKSRLMLEFFLVVVLLGGLAGLFIKKVALELSLRQTDVVVSYYIPTKEGLVKKEAPLREAYKELTETLSPICYLGICFASNDIEKYLLKEKEELLKNVESLSKKYEIVLSLLAFIFVLLLFLKTLKDAKEIFENHEVEEEALEKVSDKKISVYAKDFLGEGYEKYFKDVNLLHKILDISVICDKIGESKEFGKNKVIFPLDAKEYIKEASKRLVNFAKVLNLVKTKEEEEELEFLARLSSLHTLLNLFGNVPSALLSLALKEKNELRGFISLYFLGKFYIKTKESEEEDRLERYLEAVKLFRAYKEDIYKEIEKRYAQVDLDDALKVE